MLRMQERMRTARKGIWGKEAGHCPAVSAGACTFINLHFNE